MASHPWCVLEQPSQAGSARVGVKSSHDAWNTVLFPQRPTWAALLSSFGHMLPVTASLLSLGVDVYFLTSLEGQPKCVFGVR